MSEQIKWVSGDISRVITLTLKDKNTGDPYLPETWAPLDLSGTTDITIAFRKKGESVVIGAMTSAFVTNGEDGAVIFTMPQIVADSNAGNYEGEIILYYGSDTFTVYDTIDFLFRDRF